MSHWSRLYQEILEGVAAVCSENQGSLVLCSSPGLVCHKAPLEKPRFASTAQQKKELGAVLTQIPRKCSGLVLDHLWSPEVVSATAMPAVPMVHVMRSGGKSTIDFRRGAHLVAKFLSSVPCRGVALVVPFRGDWAITAAAEALEESLVTWPVEKMEVAEAMSRASSLLRRGFAFVCAEDNAAMKLAAVLEPLGRKASFFPLVATQGTDLPLGSATRLRYDFKMLGRLAAASILDGASEAMLRPKLHSPMIRES
jgi:DNA-binding LacI/PurR family transcriptional regulator